jgi:hypothetical protein
MEQKDINYSELINFCKAFDTLRNKFTLTCLVYKMEGGEDVKSMARAIHRAYSARVGGKKDPNSVRDRKGMSLLESMAINDFFAIPYYGNGPSIARDLAIVFE